MSPAIIARADAKAAGLKRFFTGEPCHRGHISQRYVGQSRCVTCYKIYKAAHRVANIAIYTKRIAKYRANNLERCRALTSLWVKANPKYVLVKSAERRAKLRSAEGRHTVAELDALLQRQKSRCANSLCKASLKGGYHADHIIPLALGGGNSIRNIQLLCPPCNLSKGAKHPIDWARSHGALL